MKAKTDIEWTDFTENPVTGCDPVSPACLNCYASGIANRFKGTPSFPNGFKVTLRPERLDNLLGFPDGSKVFVGSMTDLWHKDIPFDFVDQIMDRVRRRPGTTFQFLTKRADRLAEYFLTRPPTGWPYPNAWMGITGENQICFDKRWEYLRQVPAAVRWVSYEPALGPLDLSQAFHINRHGKLLLSSSRAPDLDWVVAGGESGGSARVTNPDWFRLVRDQCGAVGVPFLFKQWGSWAPDYPGASISMTRVAVFHPEDTGNRPIYVRDLKPNERGAWGNVAEGDVHMYKIGKEAAGSLLDGVAYKEFPV